MDVSNMETTARGLMSRLMKEIQLLRDDPPPGIAAWPVSEENIMRFQAHVEGPPVTPYENGTFVLDLQVPERYPFEPPRVQFVTPIFHPNIDDRGRICLDTLKPQPQGTWTPCINISTLLTTIRLLLAHPNADDGLSPEATHLYRKDLMAFEQRARAHTNQHAVKSRVSAGRFGLDDHDDDGATPMVQVCSASTTAGESAGAQTAEAMEGVTRSHEGESSASSNIPIERRGQENGEDGGEEEDWDSDVSLDGDEESDEQEDDDREGGDGMVMGETVCTEEERGGAARQQQQQGRQTAVHGSHGKKAKLHSRMSGARDGHEEERPSAKRRRP